MESKQSLPIGIPVVGDPAGRDRYRDDLFSSSDDEKFVEDDEDQFHVEAAHSFASDDSFPKLPAGSPSFSTVLNELNVDLSHSTIHPKLPISPLAFSDPYPTFETFSHSHENPESSFDSVSSPQTARKDCSPCQKELPQKILSQSWDHRNRMAAERRKQMRLVFPKQLESNSANSSPLILRKKKAKSQPGTPRIAHASPKFKILSQNISISHEDLVKTQKKEHSESDENCDDTKSIFDAPKFDRLGATPEK